MSNQVQFTDVGALLKGVNTFMTSAVVIAGSAGDNTTDVGAGVDRVDAEGQLAMSAAFLFPTKSVLAATKTLTLGAIIDHSDALASGYTTLLDRTTTIVRHSTAVIAGSTGSTGATTNLAATQLNVDLKGAKRYIRSRAKLNLSNTTADTFQLTQVCVLGGYQQNPNA